MHPDGIGIADYLQVRMDFFAVPEAEPDHVLLVERHQGSRSQSSLHGGGVSDRGDRVGRAIGTPVEQQRVSDTTSYRHRDDALVLHLDRLSTGIPQRVEDSLDVLLMHNQIVRGRVARKPAVGVALRVLQGNHQARPMDRIHSRHTGQLGGPPLHGRQRGIDRSAVHRVDSGGQRFAFGGETVHRCLRPTDKVDQSRRIAAADLGAARYPMRGGQQQPRQQAH